MFLNMCKPFLQYSGVSETYFLKIVLLTSIFSPPILCFSQEDFPNFQPKSVTPLEMFPWHIRFRDLFIYVCTECLAEFNLIMEWKMLILHCEASENVLWGLSCEGHYMKSGDNYYTYFAIYERQIQLSIIYLKDVKEKKKRNTLFTFISIKQYSESTITWGRLVSGDRRWEWEQGRAAYP